ncbi:MAG: hypothetical protein LH632_08605 [Rhodoferax sp.]|nr:hypothetical protein [Rhodoferax sp.]
MTASGRPAPRFVPTLTEVVVPPARLLAAVSPLALARPMVAADDALVEWIQAEVSDSLQRNLHDLIANALVEQIDVVAMRLRADIEPMVRRAVLDAVANEATSRLAD